MMTAITKDSTQPVGLGAMTGSVVLCVSEGCPEKKHSAQWLFDYPRVAWFPMCDRARHRLMNPPKQYQPGLSADDFTPLPLNVKAEALSLSEVDPPAAG